MDSSAEVAIAVEKNPRLALATALSKLTQPLPITGAERRVVIKPSILDPEVPGNTSLEVIRAVVGLFEHTAEVLVVESDNPYRTVEDAYSKLGYSELATENVKLFNLSLDILEAMSMPGRYFFASHKMPHALRSPLFLVNVATLKFWPEEGVVWGGIKNLFGLLPEVEKRGLHTHLEDVLLDLLSAFRPNLTVIDLSDVVIGKRLAGRRMKVGGVIVGVDPVAVDSYCTGLFGLDPMKVNYLKRAYDQGFGEALLDRIEVRGTEHQKHILVKRMIL
ncbi:MAG: DUF362 domain-containing protein [Candidatus Thorarchaeota archaeon]